MIDEFISPGERPQCLVPGRLSGEAARSWQAGMPYSVNPCRPGGVHDDHRRSVWRKLRRPSSMMWSSWQRGSGSGWVREVNAPMLYFELATYQRARSAAFDEGFTRRRNAADGPGNPSIPGPSIGFCVLRRLRQEGPILYGARMGWTGSTGTRTSARNTPGAYECAKERSITGSVDLRSDCVEERLHLHPSEGAIVREIGFTTTAPFSPATNSTDQSRRNRFIVEWLIQDRPGARAELCGAFFLPARYVGDTEKTLSMMNG